MFSELHARIKCKYCSKLNKIPFNRFLGLDYKFSKEVLEVCNYCQKLYIASFEQCENSA